MKNILFCIIIAFLFTQSYTNDFRIDQSEPVHKSAPQAMLMSAFIPGSGQMYLGKNTRAGVFLAVDMMNILSLIRFEKEKVNLTESSKLFAFSKAGLNMNATDDIYLLAHNHRSSDDYNRHIEMQARNWYIIVHNDPEGFHEYMERNYIHDSWEFKTEADFQDYRKIRNDKQNFEIYANFAIGAMIINRVISVIDAAVQTNKINNSGQLYTVPDFNAKGISVVYEYKF